MPPDPFGESDFRRAGTDAIDDLGGVIRDKDADEISGVTDRLGELFANPRRSLAVSAVVEDKASARQVAWYICEKRTTSVHRM